jgi:hypothetical protein
MSIPRRATVGYRTYLISQDRLVWPGGPGDLDGFSGRSDHSAARIHVSPEGTHHEQRETLLHELIHAALATAGAQHVAKDAARADGADPEEIYVSLISANLLSLLDQNRPIRRYLWPAG